MRLTQLNRRARLNSNSGSTRLRQAGTSLREDIEAPDLHPCHGATVARPCAFAPAHHRPRSSNTQTPFVGVRQINRALPPVRFFGPPLGFGVNRCRAHRSKQSNSRACLIPASVRHAGTEAVASPFAPSGSTHFTKPRVAIRLTAGQWTNQIGDLSRSGKVPAQMTSRSSSLNPCTNVAVVMRKTVKGGCDSGGVSPNKP